MRTVARGDDACVDPRAHIFVRRDHHVEGCALTGRELGDADGADPHPRQARRGGDLELPEGGHPLVDERHVLSPLIPRSDAYLDFVRLHDRGRGRRSQRETDARGGRDTFLGRELHAERRPVRGVFRDRDGQGQRQLAPGSKRPRHRPQQLGHHVVGRLLVHQCRLQSCQGERGGVRQGDRAGEGAVLAGRDVESRGVHIGCEDGELGVTGRPLGVRHIEGLDRECAGVVPAWVEHVVERPGLIRPRFHDAGIRGEEIRSRDGSGHLDAFAEGERDLLAGQGGPAVHGSHLPGNGHRFAALVHVLVGGEHEIQLVDAAEERHVLRRFSPPVGDDAGFIHPAAMPQQGYLRVERDSIGIERHQGVLQDHLVRRLLGFPLVVDEHVPLSGHGYGGQNSVARAEWHRRAPGRHTRPELGDVGSRVDGSSEVVQGSTSCAQKHVDIVADHEGPRWRGELVVRFVFLPDAVLRVHNGPHRIGSAGGDLRPPQKGEYLGRVPALSGHLLSGDLLVVEVEREDERADS